MDYKYLIRVRLQNGSFVDIPFYAKGAYQAQMIAESQYGPESFMGVIDTTYVGD